MGWFWMTMTGLCSFWPAHCILQPLHGLEPMWLNHKRLCVWYAVFCGMCRDIQNICCHLDDPVHTIWGCKQKVLLYFGLVNCEFLESVKYLIFIDIFSSDCYIFFRSENIRFVTNTTWGVKQYHKEFQARIFAKILILLKIISTKHSTGAQEKTRTSTPLLAHGPEPCASTNSATWA